MVLVGRNTLHIQGLKQGLRAGLRTPRKQTAYADLKRNLRETKEGEDLKH